MRCTFTSTRACASEMGKGGGVGGLPPHGVGVGGCVGGPWGVRGARLGVLLVYYLPVPCLYYPTCITLPVPCLYPACTLPVPCLYPASPASACTLPIP